MKKQQHNLLSLPQEIKDMIYDYAATPGVHRYQQKQYQCVDPDLPVFCDQERDSLLDWSAKIIDERQRSTIADHIFRRQTDEYDPGFRFSMRTPGHDVYTHTLV